MGKLIVYFKWHNLLVYLEECGCLMTDSWGECDVIFRASTLSEQLSAYKLGNDSSFLSKVTKNIFSRYLEDYIRFVDVLSLLFSLSLYSHASVQRVNLQEGRTG